MLTWNKVSKSRMYHCAKNKSHNKIIQTKYMTAKQCNTGTSVTPHTDIQCR